MNLLAPRGAPPQPDPFKTVLLPYALNFLPGKVVELLPAFMLAWPWMMARTLFSPLPFFAFALPPVVLALPLAAATRWANCLATGGAVSGTRAFWTAERTDRHGTAVAMLRWCGGAWLDWQRVGVLFPARLFRRAVAGRAAHRRWRDGGPVGVRPGPGLAVGALRY